MRATPPSVSACVREKQGGGGRPRETKVCETRDDNDERDSDPAWRRCEIRERELRSVEWRLKSQTPRVRRVRSAGQPVPARLRARARSSAGRSSRTQLGGSELAVLGHLAPDRTAAPRASRPTRADRESPGPGSDLVRDIYCWIVMKQQEHTQLKNLNVRRVSAARDETNLAAPRPYGATPYTNIHDDNRYLKSREPAHAAHALTGAGADSAFSAQFGLWIANAGTRDGLEVGRAARPATRACCVDHVRRSRIVLDPRTRGPRFPHQSGRTRCWMPGPP